jgi:hypothetical protein
MTGLRAAAGAAVALAAALALSPHATATADTPLEAADVSIVSINGSGCPAGTVEVSMSPGNDTLVVSYSDYLAWTGPGAAPEDIRKNCALGLRVDAPAGYTYAIRGLEYDGYAHLNSGVDGLQRAEYYFQGSSGTEVEHDFTGPYDGSLSSSDNIPTEDLVWAPCGEQRNLNINTELRLDATASAASNSVNLMAMESTDVPGTTLELAWKQCP